MNASMLGEGVNPGVKKTYRPEWLNDSNKIFINRLDDMCANYREAFDDVSKIQTCFSFAIKR